MRSRLWRSARRARLGRGWRARRATARLTRALRSSAHRDGTRTDAAELLLETMVWARDERARAIAVAAVDEAWAGAGAPRDRIWRAVWRLLGRAHFGWTVHQNDDMVWPLLRFLLEPDPHSRHVPRVRLLACLSPEPACEERPRALDGEPEVAPLVRLAVSAEDATVRESLFDLLCATDHPRLLTALAHALRGSAGGTAALTADGYVPVATTYGLWDDGGQPLPLLRILLTNPYLIVPPHVPAHVPDIALVLILRDRFDLLRECDQEALARTLLEMLATDHEPLVETMPAHLLDGCRRALRELSPGAGRDLVCQRTIVADVEAVAAARDAEFLPREPALAPLLLYLTRQWKRYDEADPDGGALAAGLSSLPRDQVGTVVTRLLDVRRVPTTVRGKARSALRRLPAPPEFAFFDDPGRIARDTVCDHAMRGNAEARAAAIDAGYLPFEEDLHPAFLFLTEQWDAYDRLDPDGALLRDQLTTEPWLGDLSPRAFRKVAKRAGRPDPCPPPPSRTASRHDDERGTSHHSSHGIGDFGGFGSF
ncbi:hypothetical protein SAMN05421810_11173 [Amycolatopsis arida]|uniref:Uncharacterized protein n=1 Tax=Amycolatopsis arida TaxID=587909 RepID=A0A1I6A4T2_9PSEU|nr:hypothetical protein [Amycolatopsis arida]TDX88618.1 hypothetical protein CLV69_111140 [Amycolatopsis arida]SFQ63635.1 hypothetical protein SAMN05421810_11173 [Amycolatopsis arida]